MSKVLNITKKPKYYIVAFTNEELLIPVDIIYKYNIKLNNEYDKKTYELIKNESLYLYLKDLSLNKLKRLITAEELKKFLLDKNAPKAIIDQLIFEFKERKYLDDNLYARLFIEGRRNSNGPTYFYNKLKEKGVPEYLIMENLKTFDEETPIKNLANIKMKSYKNNSNREIKQKLKRFLLNKGFTYEKINNYVDNHLILPKEDDQIQLAYLKIKRSYERKFEAKELNYKIKQKLYEKGYSKEAIDNLFHNMQNF